MKNIKTKKTYYRLRGLAKIVCPSCNCEVGKQEFARHQRTEKCKSCIKPLDNETTPSETSTVDTENIYEPLIMVLMLSILDVKNN